MELYHKSLLAAQLLARLKNAVAFTGAGVSEESGIPPFRGKGGLWSVHDPGKVASAEAFSRDPEAFWKFAREVGMAILSAKPNPAHEALAELERMRVLKGIITQNVDGLHQKAGSVNVIELHGTASFVVCTSCGHRFEALKILPKLLAEAVPRCPRCGGLLKPDVILFGDPVPEEALRKAFRLAGRAKVLLIVGSSLEVYPASEVPIQARERGAKVITINEGPSEADEYSDVVIYGKAGWVLPSIVHALKQPLF